MLSTILTAMLLTGSLHTLYHIPINYVDEYYCMIEAIHFESRGEVKDGKKAVANVILNRVESSKYPDNICEVVTQPKQFSYRNNTEPTIVINNITEKKSFKVTLHTAIHALLGNIDDNTNGATHFYAHDKVIPYWVEDAESKLTIGNHTFVKLQ